MCKTRGKCPSRTFSFSGNVSKACFEMSSPFTTVLVKMILIEFDPVGEAGVGRWGRVRFLHFVAEAHTFLNRTLPSRKLLYRKEVNRTLLNQ